MKRIPRAEICRYEDGSLLTDGRVKIERWKQYFDEHLKGEENVGTGDYQVSEGRLQRHVILHLGHLCHRQNNSLLTDGHDVIERWKQYFDEHLNGEENVGTVDHHVSEIIVYFIIYLREKEGNKDNDGDKDR